MDNVVAIFWVVCFYCLTGLFMTLARVRSSRRGWVAIYVGILLVDCAGWFLEQPAVIYGAGGLWLLLVLVPGLIGRVYTQRFLQQQYSAAYRLAKIIGWLHPADGWREQPEIIHALELAQKGEFTPAVEALKRLQGVKSLMGLAAAANLYRITNQWEELLAWHERNLQEIERHPQLLPVLLRARGETGDLRGLVELYERHKEQIRKLMPLTSRDSCRLMLFAFCGERAAAGTLMAGSLAILPPATRKFWLATAAMGAGVPESAKRQYEELLPEADPPMRMAIERRLSRIMVLPEPLDESARSIVEDAGRDQGHDERFGAQRSFFSKQARATQILIVINLLVFAAEVQQGGGTNLDTLYRMGALYGPAVLAGEWWRLFASLFLHLGVLHLAMNMLALAVLGPFVEYALGFGRYVLVYLLCGVGSMGMVILLRFGPNGQQIAVGASGCIMGLVGATGALMLRGWLREKALSAKRRLAVVVVIVAMQTSFDAVVPQVSMTAHLSGVIIGFAVTMILRDRLKSPLKHQILPPDPAAKPPPLA